MMKTTKLDYFILSSPFGELIKWTDSHTYIIHKYEEAYMNRISNMEISTYMKKGHLNSIAIADALFLLAKLYKQTPEINESIFRLIKALTSKIIEFSDDAIDNNNVKVCFMTFDSNTMLGFLKEKVDEKEVLTNLCGNIMDIHIPNSNPTSVIEIFVNNFNFTDIIQNVSNTEWFIARCEELQLSLKTQIGVLLLLFKHISDIISHDQEKIAYLSSVRALTANGYTNKFNDVAEFYKKYFGDNVECFMADVINLAFDEEETSIDEFLLKWSKEYKATVSPAVLRCILNDIHAMIQMVSDNSYSIRFNGVKETIIELWGNEKYDVNDNDYDNYELLPEDTPISYLDSIAIEAVHKDAPVMDAASKKIYKAYKTYKGAEEKVDSQLSKAFGGIKKCLTGDVRSQIIEGKEFSPIGLLKKVLGTVGLFSYSKIAAILTIVVGYALKKKTKRSERTKIIMELDTEIEMITEKIEDARGDGNREAKYAMMRTKRELENAKRKIQYGIEADERSTKGAKQLLRSVRGE